MNTHNKISNIFHKLKLDGENHNLFNQNIQQCDSLPQQSQPTLEPIMNQNQNKTSTCTNQPEPEPEPEPNLSIQPEDRTDRIDNRQTDLNHNLN